MSTHVWLITETVERGFIKQVEAKLLGPINDLTDHMKYLLSEMDKVYLDKSDYIKVPAKHKRKAVKCGGFTIWWYKGCRITKKLLGGTENSIYGVMSIDGTDEPEHDLGDIDIEIDSDDNDDSD